MTNAGLSLSVLLVEDNPGDVQLVRHHLNTSQVTDLAGEVTLDHVDSLSAGVEELEHNSYDTLFLDLGLPESTGLETLDRAQEHASRIPIVVLTGLQDQETAVQSIQRGAQDYLPKNDLDANTLARSLRYAVERHRQEEELRRQNERLDKFASVVSHDLRNPLNVAKGRLELSRAEVDSEHLPLVASALERMQTLIDDLLTVARQGDAIETFERVDLASLVEERWRTIETDQASVVVEAEREIYAASGRLEQMVENLIRNAIEHNDEPVTITIGVDEGVVFFEDDGGGIPEAERDRIFESGYSNSTDGTGLGLMIVEEIVSAHGWDISVTDSEDGGARFEITGVDFVDQ